MKVIIAGSRDKNVPEYELAALVEMSGFKVTELVCGDCRGVDKCAALWAAGNNIPVKHFPADWEKHGKSAGPLRNARMGEYADALIALPHKSSRGTFDMIGKMAAMKKPMFVTMIQESP